MTTRTREKPTWVSVVKRYQTPGLISFWQIVNSFLPFFALLIVGYLALDVSYLITLITSLLAAGFLMRIFIIQHDCGHGSFFKHKKHNDLMGNICSVFTLTPYEFWRTSHAIHHAHNGDLEHRGTGDVYTMTLNEYRETTPLKRLGYRLYRNPFIMFFIGAPLMFVLLHRAPFALPHARSKRGRTSIIRLDLILLTIIALAGLTIGLKDTLLVYGPVMFFASAVGVWMFYVQHQFEDAYWSKAPDWNYTDAALQGSTYYRLPKILQWFSGNIGLHHIHHLSPLIPNYQLQRCHDENPELQEVPTLTLWQSIRLVASGISLYDEEQAKLISFREAHRLMNQ